MNTTSRVLIVIGLLCFGAVLLSHTARINSLIARCQKLEVAIKALDGYARGIHSVLDDVVEQQARPNHELPMGHDLTNFPPAYTGTADVRALNFDQIWVTNKGLLSFGETTYPYLSASNGKDEFTLTICRTNGTNQILTFVNRIGLWFNSPTGFCLLTTNVVWQDGSVKER